MLGEDLTHCRMNVMDVTLENAMVMLCHTAETRPKKQPSRYNCAEAENHFLEAFLTSTTFKPTNG